MFNRPVQEVQAALGNLQQEMNRMFDRVWHGGVSTRPFDGQEWAPALDLRELDDQFIVYIEIPGVDAGAVDVSHLGQVLTIRGEKKPPTPAGGEAGELRGERRFGSFCRTIELPTGIDGEKISARCRDGVLEITVPKSESSKPKCVRVQVGS